jgi:predicted SprT family Zn-dependent metalloprotease
MQYSQPRIITPSLLSQLLPNIGVYNRSWTYQQTRTTTKQATAKVDCTVDNSDGSDHSPVNSVISPPIDIKASFRRLRKMMAEQLLIEYNRTAFGDLLLPQQKLPSKSMDDSTGFLEIPSPNVTIRWSNRLRTTAGRAHLMIRTPMKAGKKLSLNERKALVELQPQMEVNKLTSVTTKDVPPLSHDISVQEQDSNGAQRVAIVELSTKVVDDELRLRTTLLHELCHVAAWIVDGNVKPPHGPCFQKWVAIVTNAIQPTVPIPTKHNFVIHYKYSWECINPSCSVTLIKRHSRRSIDIKRHVCGKCRSPLREVNQHSPPPSTDGTGNVRNDATSTRHPTTRRPLTEYNRFIQTHAKIVTKQLRQQMKHPPNTTKSMKKKRKVSPQKVMKECAKLWKQHKKKIVK